MDIREVDPAESRVLVPPPEPAPRAVEREPEPAPEPAPSAPETATILDLYA